MIQFKTVKYMNFLSSGNAFTTISFDAHPTTLVVGKNGSGKSTMLDALSFVLFGKPFRNINKPQLINSVNGKNCVVELEFSIGKREYRIVRGIKPNVFEIHQDGVLINQDAASKDYQKYLEDTILKLNFKSFTQIVVLGVASFTPFMELPAASRREIIEDILDIRIFSVMNVLLKEKVSVLKEALSEVESEVSVLMHKTKLQDAFVKTLQADHKDRIDQLVKSITENDDKIQTRNEAITRCQIERDELLSHITEIGVVRKEVLGLEQLIRDLERDAEKEKKGASFYETHDSCPTCKQKISKKVKDDARQASEELLLATNDYITLYSLEHEKASQRLDALIKIEKDAKGVEDIIRNVAAEVSGLQKFTDSLVAEREQLEKKIGNIDAEKDKLRQMATEVLTLNAKKATLKEEKDYHDVASALLKDGGVKTRIIKQYLPSINKLVNKYLQAMDFFVSFELDEEFNEKIKSRHRDEFSYESFSEGEKQRINLALVFTWRNIAKMKNSTNTNLLILDEVFDSSLDGDGVDYVTNLLKIIGEQTNVWIISHRGDALTDKFANTMQFVKRNNYSVVET